MTALRRGLTAATSAAVIACALVGPTQAADSLPGTGVPSASPWTPIDATTGLAPTPAGVAAQIGELVESKALRRSGVVVLDPGSETTLMDEEGSRPLIPASTAKILTAAAALEALGPDRRLVTRTTEQADVVYLIGGGDATLPRALKSDSQVDGPASLRRLARDTATALRGTTKVDLVFDDSLFMGRALGPGWAKGFPASGVVAPVSALMMDQGRTSSSARKRVADPARKAAGAFASILEKRGVEVRSIERGKAPSSARDLAEVKSATVSEIVQQMLTESDNDVAESLGHLVGKEVLDDGSFAGGAAATTQILTKAGVDVSGMSLSDASGLSPRNQVAPITIADVLADVVREERWTSISQGLAVAGATGTLANRFATKATSAGRGVVRAKTGSLTGVGALAGTVLDDDDRTLVFVVIGNKVTSQARARETMDRIASRLAECGC